MHIPISSTLLSRLISATIALAYIVGAYILGDGEAAFRIALYLMLPLACIWFSEGMRFSGESTPGCAIAFGGWVLLFLPIVIGLIAYYS